MLDPTVADPALGLDLEPKLGNGWRAGPTPLPDSNLQIFRQRAVIAAAVRSGDCVGFAPRIPLFVRSIYFQRVGGLALNHMLPLKAVGTKQFAAGRDVTLVRMKLNSQPSGARKQGGIVAKEIEFRSLNITLDQI